MLGAFGRRPASSGGTWMQRLFDPECQGFKGRGARGCGRCICALTVNASQGGLPNIGRVANRSFVKCGSRRAGRQEAYCREHNAVCGRRTNCGTPGGPRDSLSDAVPANCGVASILRCRRFNGGGLGALMVRVGCDRASSEASAPSRVNPQRPPDRKNRTDTGRQTIRYEVASCSEETGSNEFQAKFFRC